ncbi:hypothetical protein [Nonomuraea sp. NPDC049129]|uniref:hypothetical protein n=1 Tax=Nonomuraea sp. NPDC049129 TaxID=3155272 RepID=UPI0033D1D40E
MRKTMAVMVLGFAGLLFGGHADKSSADSTAQIQEVGSLKVAYAAHGKVKQEAFWAKSYNHPHVIICVKKGDKSEAVYKIAKYAKAHRKLGYYWGGSADTKYDKLCNR